MTLYRNIIITLLTSFAAQVCFSQIKTATLKNNKTNGTYTIKADVHIPTDTTMWTLFVQASELSAPDCKPIYGKIKLNGKDYIMTQDDNAPKAYFVIDSLSPGAYKLTTIISNEYYPVTTSAFIFHGGREYTIKVYLIKKRHLKRAV